MEALFDFSKPVNVTLLEECVTHFYQHPEEKKVQNTLVTYQEAPQAWTTVVDILQKGQKYETKTFGLNILMKCVKYRWNSLPVDQRSGVRDYVVNLLIKLVSEGSETDKRLIPMLNRIVVEIAKHEWPQGWPQFIPDLVKASKRNEALCINNMSIFLLLSEEIFESEDELTQKKLKVMKTSLSEQFGEVFGLFMFIMSSSQNPVLLEKMFDSLLRFLYWIPLGFIFETPLIENLAVKYFQHKPFQNIVLQCLTEVSLLRIKDQPKHVEYAGTLAKMFKVVITRSSDFVSPEHDVTTMYGKGEKWFQHFTRHLANFITTIFQEHIQMLENFDQETGQLVILSHKILLRISQVNDAVIFRICLDYWLFLSKNLYSLMSQTSNPILLGRLNGTQNSPRLNGYKPILSPLRLVLISKMARPKEVLIVEDENGNVVKQEMRDTDAITLYASMRECLIYLTHLDPEDTQSLMLGKLSKQMDGTEWSWHNLNTLCWAIGSISGAMTAEVEKQFLVAVIKDLLQLCDHKRGKEHKAIIASNIMYVVGQYPRFLRQHWKFLKTVVNKLFEFMHEKFPGVQDMAVETYLTISIKCRDKFVRLQNEADDRVPFIEVIIRELSNTIEDLEPEQVEIFYESVATMIASETDGDKRGVLITKLMELPNQSWSRVVTSANNKFESLFEQDTIRLLISIMKTNNRVAVGLKQFYIVQFGRIYMEMLHVYKAYSEFVSNQIAEKGPQITQMHLIKQVRIVKSEILRLIETFVSYSKGDSNTETLVNSFLPPLLDPVLGDYQRNNPNARDAQVLSLFSTIVDKLGERILDAIPKIFGAVFKCTLDMISQNMEDYPDHRIKFFQLLQAINAKCLKAMMQLGQQDFQYVMNAMLWAIKHMERNTADTGLEILLQLIKNIERSDAANDFYKTYLTSLIGDVFVILTDTFHKPGFRLQAEILAKLFSIVESGEMTTPLWSGEQQFASNQAFLRSHVMNLLATGFKYNLSREHTQEFVNGLFSLCSKLKEFKQHLRDFLIQLKEFKGDNSDLFLEEKEQQASFLSQQNAKVPGLQVN